jgi:hypothetical protein
MEQIKKEQAFFPLQLCLPAATKNKYKTKNVNTVN